MQQYHMTKRPIAHIFRSKRWWILNDQHLPDGQFGECVYGLPGITHPSIAIPVDGEDLCSLDTSIHEMLHACTELAEDAVTETATDIAKCLWRLGWRKPE